MIGRFYAPDAKICLIFSNEHYEKLRELSDFDCKFNDDAGEGELRE